MIRLKAYFSDWGSEWSLESILVVFDSREGLLRNEISLSVDNFIMDDVFFPLNRNFKGVKNFDHTFSDLRSDSVPWEQDDLLNKYKLN